MRQVTNEVARSHDLITGMGRPETGPQLGAADKSS